MQQIQDLKNIASQVRRDIIRMVTLAQSGHPGGSLSSTDFVTALFFKELNCSAKNWRKDGKGNDMFFLSAGHMTPMYYSILARAGYFPVKELASFRKLGSRLQGHPSTEMNLPGVHCASGSLGQGLSVATGAALAKKANGEDNFVYVLVGDGESEEGQIWEAAMFAAHNKVNNLIAITDWNKQQIDGNVDDVAGLGDLQAKWKAFGWETIVADGHDFTSILDAYSSARKSARENNSPVMILMKTCMGKGVDFMEGTCEWHGKAPKPDLAEKALAQLEETLGDF